MLQSENLGDGGDVGDLSLSSVIAVWRPVTVTVTALIETKDSVVAAQVDRDFVPAMCCLCNSVQAEYRRCSRTSPFSEVKVQAMCSNGAIVPRHGNPSGCMCQQ